MNNDEKFTKKRHILVIGGAGYIGSMLVGRLLTRGYKVRVLDKLIYDNGISIVDFLENDNFSFIKGDLSSREDLEKSIDGITDVILLAALVGDPICKKYPELAKQTNLEGPKKLVDFLNGRGIARFIFTSTCSNYGLIKDNIPARETSDLNPLSLYAETKVDFEKYLLSKRNDFHPVILRLATAFGISRRMRFDLTVSQFTRELTLGKDFLVYDENTWRPYCHILDISQAIIEILESDTKDVSGEIFNVGSNSENYTKKMIVDVIKKKLPNVNVKYKEGGFDPRNYRVSFDKIVEKLGFKAKYTVPGCISTLINAVQNGIFNKVNENKQFFGNYIID